MRAMGLLTINFFYVTYGHLIAPCSSVTAVQQVLAEYSRG
jgi:hypothetical protein